MGLQALPLDVGVQNLEDQESHSFELLLLRPKMDAGVWKKIIIDMYIFCLFRSYM